MALTTYIHTPKIIFKSKNLELTVKNHLSSQLISQESLQLGEFYFEKIASGYFAKSSVDFISTNVGYGLFSHQVLLKGDYIGSYSGLIDVHDPYTAFGDYLYAYPEIGGFKQRLSIDAKEYGNLSRFMNHSSKPNLSKHYAFCEGLFHVIFIAARNISAYEQLLYDYGKSYWPLRGTPVEF